MKQLTLVAAFLLLLACQGKSAHEAYYFRGPALGTSYSITLHGMENRFEQAALDSLFHAVNTSMSTYQKDSDISRINAGDSTIRVDAMFREVFEISEEVFSRTQGAFDPTVGVLVDAWGFGPGQAMALDSTRVDSLMTYVGFDKVALGPDGQVRVDTPGLRFDFNAVAKGYAIDRIAVLMDSLGYEDYLLELGGEIVAKGRNRIKDKPWVVGVDDPQAEETRELKVVLALYDEALASSGNYRKFREDPETGERYVHTVDPRTGFTKNSNILGATVIAKRCAVADAYATAFMAMELDASMALLEKTSGLEAYIIYLDENGETREFMTPGFRERVSGPRE